MSLLKPICIYEGRSFRVTKPHPPLPFQVGDIVRYSKPASSFGLMVQWRNGYTAWMPLSCLELIPLESEREAG